ncbi:expressed unknown protein [Seminavis robusta]|uniref:Transmembrane protein n=1 Tax=Seminavis robusta TaxID=568900 RepID=A0A9N8EXU7_9STRA|nr:expressed unknown protein [Seminavis robusta]|eukprot:Sro2760_g336410.1 n/a (317) ;mRNA; r:2732-3682
MHSTGSFSSSSAMMTAQIHLVMGGTILDRTMPSVLRDERPLHRNRVLTELEWKDFLDDVQDAMSWSRHWYRCFQSWPVVLSLSVTLLSWLVWLWSSTLLLMLQQQQQEQEAHHNNETLLIVSDHRNTTTRTHDDGSSDSVFWQYIWPDICLFLTLLSTFIVVLSGVHVSSTFPDHVSQVCKDYTAKYQSYYGVTFSLQQHKVVTKTRRRHHARHGASTSTAPTMQLMHYILVSRLPPEEVSTSMPLSAQPYQSMSTAPFFDMPRVLLPPANSHSNVRVPTTWTEERDEEEDTSYHNKVNNNNQEYSIGWNIDDEEE